MKQLSSAIILTAVLAATPTLGMPPPPPLTMEFVIFFARGSYEVPPKAYSTLLDAVGAATRTYHGPIRVVDHIDQGEDEGLAISRANVVWGKLQRGGIAGDRISFEAAGASQPLGTPEENQRASIHVEQ